jgi:transposase
MLKAKKCRDMLRIKSISSKVSNRAIAKILSCSHQSVNRIINKAKELNLNHSLAESLADSVFLQMLYPKAKTFQGGGSKRPPAYEETVKESLKKHGKSEFVQFLDYQRISPKTAYSRSHYFYLIRKFLKKYRLAMRQQHKAGEVVYIDYCGAKVRFFEGKNEVWLKVFVGVLGASKKFFLLATPGERTVDWITGMIHMFEYFGGVTEVISIDNARALVSKPGLIPVLNKNVQAFGEHYNSIIDSCRVYKPQDKSLAELGAKLAKQRIIIPMNSDMTFHSQEEVNRYMMKQVEEINNQPLQKLKISRNQLFDDIEKAALKPLPKRKFNIITDFKVIKVPADYHIEFNLHYYSVPFKIAHELVEIVVNHEQLTVIFDHQVQAIHKLQNEKGGCTTNPAHLSPEHKAESMKTKENYLVWAKKLGKDVTAYIELQYNKTKNPASKVIGKRCQKLMNLCKEKGQKSFKTACSYALEHDMPANELPLIINALDVISPSEVTVELLSSKQNIRGKEYYGGRHEH